MERRRTSLVAGALAGLLAVPMLAFGASSVPTKATPIGVADTEIGDATVVAILDYQPMSAYHWDLLGSKMPQHTDQSRANDLPLDLPPDRWLPGFPQATDREWEVERLAVDVAGAEKADTRRVDLWRQDAQLWAGVERSTSATNPAYYWIPNSKVIGALTFGADGLDGDRKLTDEVTTDTDHWDSHGVGTTSNAVGNLHGACPECLLVFIEVDVSSIELLPEGHDPGAAEQALQWALNQPWIDVVETSWSLSSTPFTRDRVYNGGGASLTASKSASERGQTWFVSAGNGQDAQGAVATTSYTSSAQGPDWNITIGGLDVANGRYTSRTGSPQFVDVLAPLSGYPSAYKTTRVDDRGSFGATSSSAAIASGIYAKALYESRKLLGGPSRSQDADVIARGVKHPCGPADRACALGDGELTASELRSQFLRGAEPRAKGYVSGATVVPYGTDERRWATEGHGTYLGRCIPLAHPDDVQRPAKGAGLDCAGANGKSDYDENGEPTKELRGYLDIATWENGELEERIMGPLKGASTVAVAGNQADKDAWFVVDSFCRQEIWGYWKGGLYDPLTTRLPGPDPGFPTRTALEASCAHAVAPPPKPVPEPTLPRRPDPTPCEANRDPEQPDDPVASAPVRCPLLGA